MISALFNDAGYLGAKRMLDATAARHEALAANIANAETPRYQRVDLAPSFTRELKNAIAGQDVSRLRTVQPRVVADAKAPPVHLDGNTVNLERELTELSQNSLQYTVESQVASAHLARLRMAITGRTT